MNPACAAIGILFLIGGPVASSFAAPPSWIWIEGEAATRQNAVRHSWYSGEVKTAELSGGDALSHWSEAAPAEAFFEFTVPEAGEYSFWIRANPVQAKLSYSLNGGALTTVDLTKGQTGRVNLATDNKPDLRFLAWMDLGRVPLRKGPNTVSFRMDSENSHHGTLDCFLFSREAFVPFGSAKPDEIAAKLQAVAAENPDWAIWNPSRDEFGTGAIDLRFLNEKEAGESGFVRAGDGRFFLGSGKPVRFWGVNGPPAELSGEELKRCARDLAKRGVNLVRLHGSVFDKKTGRFRAESVAHFQEVAEAMKAEGIYLLLSIYFPLWLTPEPGLAILPGYDGSQPAFAALYFNPEFQNVYREWWRAILTTPGKNGRTLCEEPAIMGVEMVNEDSLFFWTFKYGNIPASQMEMLEKLFGAWLIKKHGSLEQACRAWNDLKMEQDRPGEGRMAFRHLFEIVNKRTVRDQETAAFLMEVQRGFYDGTRDFLRSLGFRGLITASNWITANDAVLGPLEKYSYAAGDFMDRHGYFGGSSQGEASAWSIRNGHVFSDRSALRFDAEEPGRTAKISHPVFDSEINDLPTMISETTFPRPNRFRTEAPLFYAVYGALQDSDSIVHFAMEGAGWQVKPRFFMQPWNLRTPSLMGQFPAAALIYRQGLVREGDVMAEMRIRLADALALKSHGLAGNVNLDELRKADVPQGGPSPDKGEMDPFVHLVGRTRIRIGDEAGDSTAKNPGPLINHQTKTVRSVTGEVVLDYGKGVLEVDAEKAQVAVGNLQAAGPVDLKYLRITSGMDLLAVALVPLDDLPLGSSRRMLLQVMSEEKPTGFATEIVSPGRFRILDIGRDPWLFREIQGEVQLKLPDAATFGVTALDLNGYPVGAAETGARISLKPGTAYYLIER